VHPPRDGRARAVRLAPAAVAVLLGAADTYVVVLALPDLLTGIGLTLEDLARAAPIVSGFLLGYVIVLPLAGRLSDVAGRSPVLVGCLLTFALGSLVTASATSLPVAVAGRGLQGLGAGGLVPPTLALVADLWAERERGLPLGVVGAAQELGAVLGPLAGAAILAVADWRAIFWVNLAAAVVLAVLLGGGRIRRRQVLPLALGVLGAAALALALHPPDAVAQDVTLGTLVVPVAGDAAVLSPLGLAAIGLLVVAVAVIAARLPRRPVQGLDLAGVLLLAVALAGIVLAFAGADTARAVVGDRWPLELGVAALAAGAFAVRQRTARSPLVPRGTLAAVGARAAVAVNLLVGVALVAVVVDVPVFARATRFPTSQLGAALVLLEFLAALPVGALLGGWAVRRQPAWGLAAGGLLVAGVALAATLSWDARALYGAPAQLLLVVAGLGFGLAIAPVNAVLLAETPADVHGLASALAVLARTVGMLVGLSVLTAVGLHVFEVRQAGIPSPFTLCPSTPTACPAYAQATLASVVGELQAVFAGAAVALAVAAVVAAAWLRPRTVPAHHELQEAAA
jgi:predicted MFS family arabinose efflux permease